ncbi:DUF5666 domain-containing protein [Streptomyces sp. RKAG293]|uniref:DUF5666 domain-containing protein n=1 Tax=Streptomyces sp. RKAG293 TaxID=2893403 RepID=UPI002033B195|nr:DUF5666 domain-containing protein [Streptomyces sp. RKAG293]MCM2417569.1 DUF5666 domain-containing protein [Streptomyces sp. RKAG293]
MARRRTDLVKADAQDPAPSDTYTAYDPGFSDPDGTTRLPVVPGTSAAEPHAFGEPGRAELLESPGGRPAARPEDVLAEPPDARDISAELSAPPRRSLPWLTLLLSGGVVAAAAFTGGALVEKNHVQNNPAAAGRSGFNAGAGAATGRTGTGGGRTFGGGQAGGQTGGQGGAGGTGGPAAGGGLTIGTVKLVDGSTIYVTDAQGNIVKVTTAGSTKVTEAKSGKVSELQPGQTVTVRGSQNATGDIAATTVTEGGASGGGFGAGRG